MDTPFVGISPTGHMWYSQARITKYSFCPQVLTLAESRLQLDIGCQCCARHHMKYHEHTHCVE